MIEYQDLIAQHQALQKLLADQPDAVEIERVLDLVAQVRDAGACIGDPRQREQLRAILRHWGGIVYERTGEYPATQLTPQADFGRLFERASEYEATCQWEEAIEVYREILDIDRHNPKATSRLARASRCAAGGYQGTLISAAARVQRWWDRRDRRAKVALVGLFVVIVLALCVWTAIAAGVAFPPVSTPTPTNAFLPTPTFTPTMTPTLAPTSTDMPSPTPVPTFTPTWTPSPIPFVSHVDWVGALTIPDRTALLPGTPITQVWLLKSTSAGRWPEGSRLVFVKGEQMAGPDEQAIEPLPAPGEMVTVSISLIVPTSDGIYEGTWQIQDVDGTPISDPLVVNVTVYQPPPPPPSYPPPDLVEVSIIQCNVIFKWAWPRELAENEWFAVRVGVGEPHSVVWVKERQYTHTIPKEGEYVWEVAICRGDPATHVCEQLNVSERHIFQFKGCGW
jgi:hypothetical protein